MRQHGVLEERQKPRIQYVYVHMALGGVAQCYMGVAWDGVLMGGKSISRSSRESLRCGRCAPLRRCHIRPAH